MHCNKKKRNKGPIIFLLLTYQINIFLYAFSFEHEPHIIVVMLLNPFGATAIKTERNRFGQSSPGNTPSAGRLINANENDERKKQNLLE